MISLSACLHATSLNNSSFLHSSSSSSSLTSLPFHSPISPLLSATNSSRITMSSDSLPPLPENRIVVGCGGVGLDFLATVATYPKPNDKTRSTSLKVQGGGNAGNALTCGSRLGLKPYIISKVADDLQGRGILKEFEADGVDTSFLAVSKEGNSPFTYVIVDSQTKTRTCIHTPGDPPMVPVDLSLSTLSSVLDRAAIAYFDARLPDTAVVVAQEAARRNIPILVDAERKREGLDDLLNLASYAVCSANFPQVWTEASSIASALVSMALRLPNMKFVIVTLEGPELEVLDVDSLLERLNQRKDDTEASPTCVSSSMTKLRTNGIGVVSGRLHVGTAEKIPPSELVDTTGAGDAFIGAILYAICANMPPEKMLPFASQVAAIGCRALGARTGLPRRTDPKLASFLQ